MKKPTYPNIPEFKNLTPEDITFGDVCIYLNRVGEIYGSPCDFCVNFSDGFCALGHKTKRLMLRFGPYESWNFKTKGRCKKHKRIDNTKSSEKKIKEAVGGLLDCGIQTYSGKSNPFC